MGFVDRGGGREAKGASLRRSKKNPGAAAARAKTEAKTQQLATKTYASSPEWAADSKMDCAVAVLSRKFDADRDRLLVRARDEANVVAIMAWCGEFERQSALIQYCADHPGRAFCAIGVHPDNVDRTNKKAHEGWVESTESIARDASCIAILTGLDLTRELATHFSQEALMFELCMCAKRLRLPIVVHLHEDSQTIERFVDWYATNLDSLNGVTMLFNNATRLLSTTVSFADFLRDNPCMIAIISSIGLFDDRKGQFEAALATVPRDRFVIGSNSPWGTPQNIPDEHLRSLPNEPANYSFILQALASSLALDECHINEVVQSVIISTFFNATEQEQTANLGDPTQPDSSDETSDDNEPVQEGQEENVDHTEAIESLIAVPGAKESSVYSCVKCRTRSFVETSLVTHREDARKVTFKSAKLRSSGDACESTLFLVVGNNAVAGGEGLTIAEDVVTCSGCGGKMGSVASSASCPCGAVMDGITARIIASRVELLRKDVDDENLLALAREERDAQPISSSDSECGGQSSKRKAKLNVKANNRSNMSHYRNKNWAPGLLAAADGLRTQANAGEEAKSGSKRRKKGRRGPISDDDE